jgi:hypothetical protein
VLRPLAEARLNAPNLPCGSWDSPI